MPAYRGGWLRPFIVAASPVAPAATPLRHHATHARTPRPAPQGPRFRLPPVPLQCTGGAGRPAGRTGRGTAGRWRLAASGRGAGAAVLDAALAAAGAGRATGHL